MSHRIYVTNVKEI
ncbi:Uncharacterised protein g7126 [Pycnogonum litorale]